MPVKDKECVFCEIAAGRADAEVICEDELSMCILDINPFAKGHCLVIPKRHVPWWHDLEDAEIKSLFSLAQKAANKIMRAYKPDFVCMYARGRRIPHTHVFLVPSYSGDPLDRFFNALEGFQESPEVLVELRSKESLKQAKKDLDSIE